LSFKPACAKLFTNYSGLLITSWSNYSSIMPYVSSSTFYLFPIFFNLGITYFLFDDLLSLPELDPIFILNNYWSSILPFVQAVDTFEGLSPSMYLVVFLVSVFDLLMNFDGELDFFSSHISSSPSSPITNSSSPSSLPSSSSKSSYEAFI